VNLISFLVIVINIAFKAKNIKFIFYISFAFNNFFT
jgi:hypothetical protein